MTRCFYAEVKSDALFPNFQYFGSCRRVSRLGFGVVLDVRV
jgi:hypothetical protein